jgi:hypothetical protein
MLIRYTICIGVSCLAPCFCLEELTELVRVSAVMQICKWKLAGTLVLGRIYLNHTAMRGPTICYVGLLLLAVS